jgi:hypothetical protein
LNLFSEASSNNEIVERNVEVSILLPLAELNKLNRDRPEILGTAKVIDSRAVKPNLYFTLRVIRIAYGNSNLDYGPRFFFQWSFACDGRLGEIIADA